MLLPRNPGIGVVGGDEEEKEEVLVGPTDASEELDFCFIYSPS
jgi:hypothetical protein